MLTSSNTQLPPPSNWEDFEYLCWLLWRAEWADQSTQKHGRKGQPQHGVDVYGRPNSIQWAGVQCKGKDNFSKRRVTETELKREVRKAKKFNPPLSEFILATTAPRDEKIQGTARALTTAHQKKGLFSVRIASWDDIRDLLNIHPDVVASLYAGSAINNHTQAYDESISRLQRMLSEREAENKKELAHHTQNIQATVLCGLFQQGQDLNNIAIPGISPEQMSEVLSVLKGEKQTSGSKPSSSMAVLSPERTRILGLLAVSIFPCSSAVLRTIFHDIKWKTHLSYLKRHNIVQLEDGQYMVPSSVTRSFVKNEDDKLPYLEEWISALKSLPWHPDTEFLLAAYLMAAGMVSDAINKLVEAAESLPPGPWNGLYLSTLLEIDQPQLNRLLTKPQKAKYFNSLALCLFRAKRHQEAITWFKRLCKYSKRIRCNWGIGQSYHNCGIVHLEMGELRQSEDCLRKAIAHSRSTRDHLLLGRSLNQLAIVVAPTSLPEARKLLEESERIKKKENDKVGLVGVNHGYAILAVQNEDYREALKWFKKAETAARRFGHYEAEALERYNVGRSYIDIGDNSEALQHLRHARQLAERDELHDVRLLALGGEAIAYVNLGHFKQAEKVFTQLFSLHDESTDVVNAAISLHDVGAMLLYQKKYDEARKALRRAVSYSRRNNVLDWLCQSLADIGLSYVQEGKEKRAVAWLVEHAAKEDDRNLGQVAAELWLDAIEYSIEYDLLGVATARAVKACTKIARRKSTPEPLRAQLLTTLHLWHWHTQDFQTGITALNDLLKLAKDTGDKELFCRAQDQIGVCLQELNHFSKAVTAHRAALKVARKLADPDTIETSLNNLGEALRKTGHHSDAISHLQEAENSARERNDSEAAISIAHNRALSIEHQREFREAEAVFRKCRDEARRAKLWHEYVRALHALANLAWHEGIPSLALKRYKTALDAADKYDFVGRHEICLNYSNALSWNEQPKKALQVLQSAESEFGSIPIAHIYHSELARLHDEVGNRQLAKKQWKLSYESAVRVGNDDAIAESCSALAESDSGMLEKADAHYVEALKQEEDDSRRLDLLIERLSVLLQMQNESEASKVFREIDRLSAGKESQAGLIDALIMSGDYNWTDGNSQCEALKAYLIAMALTDVDRFFEVGGTIVYRLLQVKGRNRKATVRKLRDSSAKWLAEEHGTEKDVQGYLLWPFAAALRLTELKHPNAMSEEEYARVLEEEFDNATAHGPKGG